MDTVHTIHKPDSCKECPLYSASKGFVLGCGDPHKAKIAIILEAPGSDEIRMELKPNANRAFYMTQADCDKELQIRRRDYPNLPEKFIRLGAPVVGQTGGALMWWIWPKVGLKREDFYIDNTIRCLPPKKGNGQYPTGVAKKEAEKHCRQYDRIDTFRPDTFVFSLHPAGILREIAPLPLVVKDFEKVRDFTQQGRRVLVLLGGKATAAFARYGSNVSKWRGHYQALAADWSETYKSLFEFAKTKRKKVDKKVNMSEDVFAVPETITKRAKEKKSRPAVLLPGQCKSFRRHRGGNPPKCGYSGCWDAFDSRQVSGGVQLVRGVHEISNSSISKEPSNEIPSMSHPNEQKG